MTDGIAQVVQVIVIAIGVALGTIGASLLLSRFGK
jgi:hypothetical protein